MSKSVGIVAEYNPFHLGHRHQIDLLRLKGFETVVVAMSGACVQRGQFAMLSKFTRAQMALENGVDVVIEIPFPFSCDGAEGFALAGMTALKNAGVNSVCFGSESDDLTSLQQVAQYLLSEEYSLSLKNQLALGLSFATARQNAVFEKFELTKDFLTASNDILAIEYIKACMKLNWQPEFIPIKRQGAGYKNLDTAGGFASASGIRKMVEEYRQDTAVDFIPKASRDAFIKNLDRGQFFLEDSAYEKAVLFTLRMKTAEDFALCPHCNQELAHAFEKACGKADSLNQLFENLPTKQYPKSRLSRIILFTFLNATIDLPSSLPYLRLLALSKNGEIAVKEMAKTSVLPLSPSIKILSQINEDCKKVVQMESRANDSFATFCRIIQPPRTDFTTKIIKSGF